MLQHKYVLLCIEYAFVVVFCIIPPLFSIKPFFLPKKPHCFYDTVIFICSVVLAAGYEELLYRVYIPYRLHTIVRASNSKRFAPVLVELAAIVFFALAHRYLGWYSVLFALGAGIVFRFIYLRIKEKRAWGIAFFYVVCIHSGWNIAVYYYLWA